MRLARFFIGFCGLVGYIGGMVNTWRIVFWLGAILVSTVSSLGQTWIQTSAPNQAWFGIASSADQSTLIAVVNQLGSFRGFCVSTNSGATWVSYPTFSGASCAAVSADGVRLIVLFDNLSHRQVLTSHDGGSSWQVGSFASVIGSWLAVASSADGMNVVATTDTPGTGIFISHSAGAVWVTNSMLSDAGVGFSVASSADGTKLFAAYSDSHIYISTNSGVTWKTNISLPGGGWISLVSSADGNKVAAACGGGKIYTSTNSGGSWKTNTVPVANWRAIASSADGSKLAAAISGGNMYFSTNSGATWKTNDAPTNVWISLASSADGNSLAMADANNGGIWMTRSIPAPKLNIALSPGKATVSWLIPSTNFVLQQSTDLGAWSNVTNSFSLDLTNLQNEVTIPLSGANNFYRLASP